MSSGKLSLFNFAPPERSHALTGVLAFGNPLLDIIVEADDELLRKYCLELNNAVRAGELHRQLFDELDGRPGVKYVAGGMVQNAIRVCQWMLQMPQGTAFVGCVGTDARAHLMRDACADAGVRSVYEVHPTLPTGCCACLMQGAERAMCVDLQAAGCYSTQHVTQPHVWALVQESKIIYTTLNFTAEVVRALAHDAVSTGCIFCINLTAATWIRTPAVKAVLAELLPLVDVLLGNEKEAQAWAEEEGWDTTDVAFIALRLSLVPGVKARKRIVVITQGGENTVVAVQGHVSLHAVFAVDQANLVCTVGAGDAYAGGFLAAMSKDLPLHDCCSAGAYAASIVVQHVGCTFDSAQLYAW